MAEGKAGEHLVAFKSGHYKKVVGTWKGDSVWMHFQKTNGGMVHVNKAEVEYVESFAPPLVFDKIDYSEPGVEGAIKERLGDCHPGFQPTRGYFREGLLAPNQVEKSEIERRRP